MNVYYHLPGLFEFYEFYKKFLPLFKKIKQNTFMTGVRLALSMARHLIVYGLVDASVMQIVIQKKSICFDERIQYIFTSYI